MTRAACRENELLRQQVRHGSETRGTETPTVVTLEGSAPRVDGEALREAAQCTERLEQELAQEISRGEQVLSLPASQGHCTVEGPPGLSTPPSLLPLA